MWRALPGLLISVVFAALFLGHRLPSPKQAFAVAGPQISFGLVLGSGQYVAACCWPSSSSTPSSGCR